MRANDYPGWKPLPWRDKRHRLRGKLTERQIKLIKADRVTKYKDLAARFEVSIFTIGAIKSGRQYANIR